MAWSWEWVVEIRSGKKLLGTGAMIAPGRILTARHVAFDRDGAQKPDLKVCRDKKPVSATVAWSGTPEIDAAVLAVELDCAGLGRPLASLTPRDVDAHTPWEVKGFPQVSEKFPNFELKSVQGSACSWSRRLGERTPMLELNVGPRPDLMGGLSGAPVVIGRQIAGVLRAVPGDWSGGRVEATPVAAFIENNGFRKSLGLTAEDEKFADELERLRQKLEARLCASPSFMVALAEQLGVDSRGEGLAGRVAWAVVGANGETIAVALDELVQVHNDVVREVLREVLPLAVDWHDSVLHVRAALARGENVVELLLRTETVAEIVLAGADGRCCDFTLDAKIPEGQAHVRMPALVHSPMFLTRETLLQDAVVQNLGAEMGVDAANPDELRIMVEHELRVRANAKSRHYHPRYLLFIDVKMKSGDAEIEVLWALVRKALSGTLPSLRLVRLLGGAKELLKEVGVANRVKKIRDFSRK